MLLKEKIFLGLAFVITLFFYYPIFYYGFSQDDFIHLFSSIVHTPQQVLNFFNPFARFPDIFFYRPLATQFYFFINNFVFGLNPFVFRLEALITHLINSYLFFVLIRKVWKNKKIALISGILYSSSAIHFLSLFYISSFQQIGRMFFILLTLILFINFQKTQKFYYLWFSLLTFTLSLLSKETGIILPGLIFILELIRTNHWDLKKIKSLILKLIPFLFIITIYISLRLSGLQSIFIEGSYRLSFTFNIFFQNMKWYLLWILGLPEIIDNYPSISLLSLLQFVKDYKESFFLILFFIILIAQIFLGFLLNFKRYKKLLILNLTFFLVSLSSVLFLEKHRYPQYLDTAFIVLLPTIALLISNLKLLSRLYIAIFILFFLLLQFFSLRLTEGAHWTTHRSEIASYYLQKLNSGVLPLNQKTTVIFLGDDFKLKEVSYALAIDYALKVSFPNQVDQVMYINSKNQINNLENKVIINIDKY